jgi:Flp pilus assembly protein TadD
MAWWKFWEQSAGRTPDYYEEGVVLVRQEMFHDALTSFRLALKTRPDDPATLEHMAVAYTHIGLPEEAVRSYQRALAIRPQSPSAHYGLAFLLLKHGRRDEASHHLEAFLSHARPGREEERHIVHARRTLERLGGSSGDAPR